MKDIREMTREELLEVIRIKNVLIKELRDEIEAYRELCRELQVNSKSGSSEDKSE